MAKFHVPFKGVFLLEINDAKIPAFSLDGHIEAECNPSAAREVDIRIRSFNFQYGDPTTDLNLREILAMDNLLNLKFEKDMILQEQIEQAIKNYWYHIFKSIVTIEDLLQKSGHEK